MTEAAFWAFIRSGLRSKSQRWAPIYQCLKAARRKSQSSNPRLKWEFQCAITGKWFPRKEVEVDHIVPCGSLKSFADLPGFVERLFCEADGLRVVSKAAHLIITKESK